MQKAVKYIFAGLGLVFIDQLVKLYFFYAQNHLVSLNGGGAFSLADQFSYYQYVVIVLLIILSILIYRSQELQKHPWPIVLIYAGAVSDLIDRIRLGGVIDFIDLKIWPSFNLADAMIVVGFIWLFFVGFARSKESNRD